MNGPRLAALPRQSAGEADMSDSEKGRKGGTSFPMTPDTHSKTARPTSVGPHDVRHGQEDPENPGIKPEKGYGAEIARNNEAAAKQPAGSQAATPSSKTETRDESGGTDEMLDQPGAPRDAPPLSGTAKE
jgi:hypothetical protein